MTSAALKLQGPWEVRRKFRIPALSDADGAEHVEQALNQVAGVRGLAIDFCHHLVRIRYETTETDYTTIRNALNANGTYLSIRQVTEFANLLTGKVPRHL